MALTRDLNTLGRVVFVTGGANGIGRGICNAFLAAGHTVFSFDLDKSALERAAEAGWIAPHLLAPAYAPAHAPAHAPALRVAHRRLLTLFSGQEWDGDGRGKLHTICGDVSDQAAVTAAVQQVTSEQVVATCHSHYHS